MIKKHLPIALAGLLLLGACQQSGFQKTKDGLEYKIVKDEKSSPNPKVGDVVKMNFIVRYKDAKTDTVLLNSRTLNGGQPLETPLPEPTFSQDWTKGLALMTPGDSAVIRMSVDSLRKAGNGGMLPPFMKNGEFVTVEVSLLSVKTQEQARAEMKQKTQAQDATDDKIIQDYLTKNNIKAQKTSSGLYYIIDQPGTGPNPQNGNEITMNYTGQTLDGKTFDSNVDPAFQHVEPFKFVFGQGGLIQGWIEGVSLMSKGSKARIFVPSSLAYGSQGRQPKIAPNTVLMFTLEITNIGAPSPAAQQQQPQPGAGANQ